MFKLEIKNNGVLVYTRLIAVKNPFVDLNDNEDQRRLQQKTVGEPVPTRWAR